MEIVVSGLLLVEHGIQLQSLPNVLSTILLLPVSCLHGVMEIKGDSDIPIMETSWYRHVFCSLSTTTSFKYLVESFYNGKFKIWTIGKSTC